MSYFRRLEFIAMQAVQECEDATEKFAPFHSAHEGYAVLKEEVDELWEVVKRNQSTINRKQQMRKEAIQVAAMAIRLIHDCCDTDIDKEVL